MHFENTARGWSSVITSASGSVMAGRSQMKCGRSIVEGPADLPYREHHTNHAMETPVKIVLITGCSSGYGLETARHFHAQGWNVIATMRTPREDLLPRSDRMRVLALDVTSADSIAACVASAGPIDVLVNNAGIGALGAFEATPMQ